MKRLSLSIILFSFFSCTKTPQPINYGTDMCHFCKMTIVTKTHASQLVTNKGKQYKFDAIECMIHFLEDKRDIMTTGNILIANYNEPGQMIDAKTANYVVCKEITSPMGANLSGFKNSETAKKVVNDRPAQYYDWEGIFNKIN